MTGSIEGKQSGGGGSPLDVRLQLHTAGPGKRSLQGLQRGDESLVVKGMK